MICKSCGGQTLTGIHCDYCGNLLDVGETAIENYRREQQRLQQEEEKRRILKQRQEALNHQREELKHKEQKIINELTLLKPSIGQIFGVFALSIWLTLGILITLFGFTGVACEGGAVAWFIVGFGAANTIPAARIAKPLRTRFKRTKELKYKLRECRVELSGICTLNHDGKY